VSEIALLSSLYYGLEIVLFTSDSFRSGRTTHHTLYALYTLVLLQSRTTKTVGLGFGIALLSSADVEIYHFHFRVRHLGFSIYFAI